MKSCITITQNTKNTYRCPGKQKHFTSLHEFHEGLEALTV